MRWLWMGLLFVCSTAFGQLQVEGPWSRATAPGAKVAAGYMVIRNQAAAADRLIGASSPAAERMETHITVRDGEVMRMREVKGYDIPAKGSFELKPGGPHLMFVGIRQAFKPGERIPAVLKFEKAGEVKVELEVRSLSGQPAHRH